MDSRYIVGIDLGTTNVAVSYMDTEDAPGEIKVFPILQVVASGELRERDLLPSFCFMPDEKRLQGEDLSLPWREDADFAVGFYARDTGGEVPARFISSAKSWLCHAGVDRRRNILPWASKGADYAISPIEATRRYLEHVRQAWDAKFAEQTDRMGNPCVLSAQQVVVTVPASFDETARELTLEAARKAKLGEINLLEEPLAVFYSWLHHCGDGWRKKLESGGRVLIVDVGGGTSDFSIVELDSKGVLNRTAAGEHLLLGGDNIDAAIAREAERAWKTSLSADAWTTLCQKARAAKERLLGEENLEKTDITLLAKGSSVIGGAKTYTLERSRVMDMMLEGFFPKEDKNTVNPKRKSGIQTMGLPYVNDPAVTKYVLEFLRYASSLDENNKNGELIRPDFILFNGGAMIPKPVRERVLEVVSAWFPENEPVSELDTIDLQLAVGYGATYYGAVRRGEGVKVKSGISRSYYIQVEYGDGGSRFICVMPRGGEEGTKVKTPRKFELVANQTVDFPMFASHTRPHDKVGSVVEDHDDLMKQANLVTALTFGRQELERRKIEAELAAELTATGILKVWVESSESRHKWPLNFDIRFTGDEEGSAGSSEGIVVDCGRMEEAKRLISDAFTEGGGQLSGLMKGLESTLQIERQDWSVAILRELADALLDIPYDSLKTAQKEFRWLNLCGFCLRPGLGEPEDGVRIKRVWKIWFRGMNNPGDVQTASEWWVFWRRVASGLGVGRQMNIYQTLSKLLFPKLERAKKVKGGAQTRQEMWRCLGALELLPLERKNEIGDVLISNIDQLEDCEFWVIARLGARHLFHASAELTIPVEKVEEWLELLMKRYEKNGGRFRLFAISRLAGMTGDRHLDVSADMRDKVRRFLEKQEAETRWVEHVLNVLEDSREESKILLGDSLPLGLSLIDG